MEVREPAELAALAASPLAAELVGDVAVVDLAGHPADLSPLADLPVVVVGIGPGPCDDVDVLVADDLAAERVAAAVAARPVAAAALALHLRVAERLPVGLGLAAESATYSALQAGPEHAAWLASRPGRPPRPGDDPARVRVARDGHRLRVALARPAARNAVDAAMQRALVDALGTAGDDVTEVLLTGDGPTFSGAATWTSSAPGPTRRPPTCCACPAARPAPWPGWPTAPPPSSRAPATARASSCPPSPGGSWPCPAPHSRCPRSAWASSPAPAAR